MILIASIGLGFGIITGCGGGGSDGGTSNPETPVVPAAGLDSEKVNKNATQIATSLGCTYTAETPQSKIFNIPLSAKTIESIKTVMTKDKVLKYVSNIGKLSKETEQTIKGDCGGTLVMKTTENDAETEETMDFKFNKYCTSKVGDLNITEKTTIDGSAYLEMSEESETKGTIAVSTPTPITITSTNPNTKEKIDTTIDLQGGNVVINSDANEEMTTIQLEAKSIKLTNNITKQSCTASDFEADIDMKTKKTTFNTTVNCTDTDTGSVEVKGNIDLDDNSSTIEVTDANGKKGTLTSTETKGVLKVSFDGETLGTMDCSMIDIPGLPE
jgi:hypothetical protein